MYKGKEMDSCQDAKAEKQAVNKLILFVTEACNLRCRYCYVRRGQNGNGKRVMSEKTARQIARAVFARYDSCNFVQFFGGEPSLNMPALWAFVDEAERLAGEGIIPRVPRFGIVTNGASSYAQDMVAFCKEHDIGATVSLDGYRHIHDALRPSARGEGTYDNAIETIRMLQNVRIPVAVESVYTSFHIEQGCSITDLFKFVESLGVKKLIFHTAYPPAPKELCPFDKAHFKKLCDYHAEAVSWWFESLARGRQDALVDVYFKDLLSPLLQGGGAGVSGGGCPAGIRDFSVGPDGDVYSCHLLYKSPQFYKGNLLSDEELQQGEPLPLHTAELPECEHCFARHWCQPCGALNLRWGDAWTPPEYECELRRTVLLRIGELAFGRLTIPDNSVTEVLRTAAGVEAPPGYSVSI